MFYKKPTYKKEKVNGHVEGYKFKDIQSLDLTIETNAGGWDNMELSKEDRVIYVLAGLGFAKIKGRTHQLEEGIVLEIPSGTEVEMSGQLKYICAKTRD